VSVVDPSTLHPSLQRPELPDGAGSPRRPGGSADAWRPGSALLAFLGAFLAVIVVGLIAGGVAAAFGASIDDPPAGLNIGLTYFQDAAFVCAAILCARLVAAPRARDFGLRVPPRVWVAVGLSVAVMIAFYVTSAAWVAALGQNTEENLPSELGADDSTVALIAVMILVTVGAPIAEEFFFRGFFFRSLRNWCGPWLGALATGAIFGAIHFGSADAVALLPLAILGFGLCLLYHWTGSLYPCIALHALNNAIAFSVTQDWGWQIPLVIVGAITASVLLARQLGRLLEAAAERSPDPPARPA
jgi:membrane protease YdiL (CAAX protease family)